MLTVLEALHDLAEATAAIDASGASIVVHLPAAAFEALRREVKLPRDETVTVRGPVDVVVASMEARG